MISRDRQIVLLSIALVTLGVISATQGVEPSIVFLLLPIAILSLLFRHRTGAGAPFVASVTLLSILAGKELLLAIAIQLLGLCLLVLQLETERRIDPLQAILILLILPASWMLLQLHGMAGIVAILGAGAMLFVIPYLYLLRLGFRYAGGERS